MKNKITPLLFPQLVVLTMLSGLISTAAFAISPKEALYESRAELESAQMNQEDAQAGLDMSNDDLIASKDNYASLTAEAKDSAKRIRSEIARLEKQQKRNVLETQRLNQQIQKLKQQARKNESQEKQLAKKSAQMEAKMDKVRNAWSHAKSAEQRSFESLRRAEAAFQKSKSQNQKEQKRLTGEMRRSLAQTAANRKRAETLRAKKNQQSPSLGRVGLN